MPEKLQFNIIATVGTTEAGLAPYPGGSATTPTDKYRKIYGIILSNSAATANTLTLRIYKGASLEASVNMMLGANMLISIISNIENPILIVPPDRTLKAVASAESINVLMAAIDE